MDNVAKPLNPAVEESAPGDQDTGDIEIEAPQNLSREFVKLTNQALQLNVSTFTWDR